jgi:subtilisin family serine protease
MRIARLRSLLLFISLSGLAAMTAVAAGPGGEGKAARGAKVSNNAYIVQLAEPPVVAYGGGITGYLATRPARGRKIDPNDPEVVRYRAHLTSRHDAVLAGVGGGRKLYSYGYAYNGFAADLTPAQADRLRRGPGVVAVTKDEARALDTATTPEFLGLSGPGGFWATSGFDGDDVVIGIVDTGIWPEHPSVSDRVNGKRAYQQLPGWHGKCTPGEQFNASHCNQKLIGARYYNQGYGGNAGVKAVLPYEFLSPRDYDGHGTHTASTAAGNANVPASGPAAVFGTVSGMAPRARIAVYKVCWGEFCFSSDSVAAIDQAVADGVDVINFSIGGTRTSFRDPVEVAFLFAADAGVFVAASAGNDGPASSTVAHPGPWLTTVAAGTHNRDGTGSVTLGSGSTYYGASLATAVPSKPLIAAAAAGLTGADPALVQACFAAVDNGGVAVLDPAKVKGKIVVCDRGVNARPNKSLAVAEAGGVGMILVNTSPNTLHADLHFVPTVHLDATDGEAILIYAAMSGATASINASTIVLNAVAPLTAAFSSRGPLQAAGGDLLKPDLMAPGVDVLAGVAPPGHNGRLFDMLSGTSMSSPHVAGIAALLRQAKPDWSPMAIKSALMTTAGDALDGGSPAPNTNPVLIFRQGAGHVRPGEALNPGLVFSSTSADWLAFICGVQPGGGCSGVTPIDASDLNVASIAIGDMAGVQKVTRRVTNVGTETETYTASVTGMTGIAVSVNPSTITLAPGETKSFEVQFLRTSAPLNAYSGGQFTLATGDHTVRIPIVVRPIALAAPAQVTGNGTATNYAVRFGYDGPFTATARGMVAAAVTSDTVTDDPSNGACSLASPNAKLIPVAIPAGTTYARFALFDADATPGSDLDLCVFRGSTLMGSSTALGSAEEVNLTNPDANTYTVVVQGYAVAGSSSFRLHTWLLGFADAGNMTVSAPASATTGSTGSISLGFGGLAAGTKYLGAVAYGGSGGLPNPTIIRVDMP